MLLNNINFIYTLYYDTDIELCLINVLLSNHLSVEQISMCIYSVFLLFQKVYEKGTVCEKEHNKA